MDASKEYSSFRTNGGLGQSSAEKYHYDRKAALTWRKPSGPGCRLTGQQLTQLVDELNKGAEPHALPGLIWTGPRVNEVIKKLFGVSYDVSPVSRLLKRLEYTPKPLPKAWQQSPQRAQQWRDERLPHQRSDRTQKKPGLKGGSYYIWMNPLVIYLSIDHARDDLGTPRANTCAARASVS